MNNPILKIWFIILILGVTFSALTYWGIGNYKESAISIRQIVQPDEKTNLTNNLFKSVIQSDLHLNNFILTNDSLQLYLSTLNARQSDSLITVLQDFTSEKDTQYERIDSLKRIIGEKARVNAILVELKKKQSSHFFTEKALNRIKGQLSDSAFIDMAITRKEDLVAKRDTIERIDIVRIPVENKGISGFFRKVFGKERIQIDTLSTLEEQINYSLEVSVDSSIVRNYFIDTTIFVVKNILIDVLDEEIKLQKELYATEMDILSYNELLLQNTRKLLEDISLSNEISLSYSQASAIEKIENAHRKAFLIAGVGILLGLVLLIILINDIIRTNVYRKKLEQEKDRAEQLAVAKEVFLSKMSHEIRTPIHSISGFANLMENEVLSTRQTKLVNGISYSNQYLNELIDNILEQAKINAGNYRLEESSLYIPKLCREMEVLFKIRQEEQHDNFKIGYSENLDTLSIRVDRVKFKQVLVNLLGNAFKFTLNGTVELQFALEETGEKQMLKVNVADTGMGIDPQQQAHIFTPFNQTPYGHKANVSGTGLGLSISKHIVESFGGTIGVQSALGHGSTFFVEFPVASQPYVPPAVDQSETTDLQKLHFDIHVLAVEDDQWNAYLLENYLSPHVSSLQIHENAEEALQVVQKKPEVYDLILTDLNLPGMGGKDFFKALASSKKLVHVFALSATLGKNDVLELSKLGFAEAIGKPFSQMDLLMAIDRHFQRTTLEGTDLESGQIHINFEGINAFVSDDPLQLAEQQSNFIKYFVAKVEHFAQAIKAGDSGELGRMAHQLKSSCEQIGVTDLSERLHTIEVYAQLGKAQHVKEEAIAVMPKLNDLVKQLSANHPSIL